MDYSHMAGRNRCAPDLEDLALTFIEEEVGRHDWQENWQRIKEAGTATLKLHEWLTALGCTDITPTKVEQEIDRLAKRPGKYL